MTRIKTIVHGQQFDYLIVRETDNAMCHRAEKLFLSDL